jgi:riboflavin kinase / FMN adenylyltransferase
MQTLHSAEDFRSGGRKVSIAIGTFDGVHLGHQQVIRQAVSDARQHEGLAVVVTFDRHPNSIVAPDRVPPQIYSQPQKLRALASLGADATLVIPFTREFSALPAEDFIRALVTRLAPVQSVCVGSSFVFGRKRSGDVALLQRLGAELNFVVHGLAAVALDGEMVSSTRIREMLRAGEINRASQMLGREYALAGLVTHGDEMGRQLGFPTANLDARGLLVPPNGVFAAHARVAGAQHRAAVNIGVRPTLASSVPELRVEAHLLDFTGDLYGQEMELTFVAKLRDERKFASLDELRAQITLDVAAARGKF